MTVEVLHGCITMYKCSQRLKYHPHKILVYCVEKLIFILRSKIYFYITQKLVVLSNNPTTIYY